MAPVEARSARRAPDDLPRSSGTKRWLDAEQHPKMPRGSKVRLSKFAKAMGDKAVAPVEVDGQEVVLFLKASESPLPTESQPRGLEGGGGGTRRLFDATFPTAS